MPLSHIPFSAAWLYSKIWRAVNVRTLLLFSFSTPVQFVYGAPFYLASFKSLKYGAATMDVLVALGTSAAYVSSLVSIVLACRRADAAASEVHPYFETSAMLITFVLLGRYLEATAKGEASEAVSALMSIAPSKAVLVSEGREEEVDVVMLQVGDTVKVRFPPRDNSQAPMCSNNNRNHNNQQE